MSTPATPHDAGAAPAGHPPLPAGAVFGIWVGCFGWWFGTLLATIPYTLELRGPLAVSALLTAVVACAVHRVARQGGRRTQRAVMALAIVALLSCYWLVVEPALLECPELVRRLRALGTPLPMPGWIVPAVAVVGGLVAFWPRRRRADAAAAP